MPEYNTLNEVAKKQYEEILLHGQYRDTKTVRATWQRINLFESFTRYESFKTFSKDQAISFKAWLEKRTNKKGELLSLSSIRSTLKTLRDFFQWLAIHPQYGKKFDGKAIEYLRLSDNANRAARASRPKTPPTLEQVKTALSAMPHETDIEKRDRALFALTIITGARDDALVTLKIRDVDGQKRTIWQNPRHVRTKGRKSIVTRFVRAVMPSAEDIVLEWLEYAVSGLEFKPNDPLFPRTLVVSNPASMSFETQGLSREHWANAQPVRVIFKEAFEFVGIQYFNPHLFRNAICKWALDNCTQREYKALSQNIGHDHAMTTYNSYGTLTEDEQLEAVAGIGQSNPDLRNASTKSLLEEFSRRAGT